MWYGKSQVVQTLAIKRSYYDHYQANADPTEAGLEKSIYNNLPPNNFQGTPRNIVGRKTLKPTNKFETTQINLNKC